VIAAADHALMEEPPVLELTGDYVIVGDIHGDLTTLLRIFDHLGWPPARSYLFLGDYVDRGMNSCEVILLLYALKYLYPSNVLLIRGNHEFGPMTEVYGFQSEAVSKFSDVFYLTVIRTFDDLPLAAVLDDSVLCVHGGISPKLSSLNDLRQLGKVSQWTVKFDDIATDLLWGDPSNEIGHFSPSGRGCGFRYGPDATKTFLQKSGLKLLIRAHELCAGGFQWHFGQSVLTLFSTCDYCQNGYNAAAARYSRESGIEFAVFEPLEKYDEPDPSIILETAEWDEDEGVGNYGEIHLEADE
jgi:diadenosine tetraphosphatase ApaH/serine/threonine PP2A family protein phosphatase